MMVRELVLLIAKLVDLNAFIKATKGGIIANPDVLVDEIDGVIMGLMKLLPDDEEVSCKSS